jgi:hypothetical protein
MAAWAHKDEARTEMHETLARLKQLTEEPRWDQDWVQAVMRSAWALQAYVLAAATSLGECRKQSP